MDDLPCVVGGIVPRTGGAQPIPCPEGQNVTAQAEGSAASRESLAESTAVRKDSVAVFTAAR
jgi:hypothetical protein